MHFFMRLLMEKAYYFDRLMESGEFRFDKLHLEDIDNSSVKKFHRSQMSEVETNLFHRDVASGDEYLRILHNFIEKTLSTGNPAPIVRFADGEYAFYANSLHCNGLYQQAESVEAIKRAMPMHIEALEVLNQTGKLAPVVYPGNVQYKKKFLFPFIRKPKSDGLALHFLEFLFDNNVKLTRDNYLPFHVVYAYLTSRIFSQIMDGKNICIVNSECNLDLCNQWFARFSSHPNIVPVEIPDSYVATRWGSIKEDVLAKVPNDAALCLVGAGIGALLVCVDVAHEFSIPAIDAGHVLNMMNDREDKSAGPRLYTIHKKSAG
jgi:hypothetical protein